MTELVKRLQALSAEALPHIVLGAGALDAAAQWTAARGARVLLVCDPNTWRAAGETFAEKLRQAGLVPRRFCYPAPPLPDEQAIGTLFCHLQAEDELLLAVGSGTLGDICKYVAWRMNFACAVVATAPSMDGYVSAGAALLLNGVKTTPRTCMPAAVFCDTDILCAAPLSMIASGLGDLLGKYTALADWKLAALLANETYRDDLAALIEDALRRTAESAAGAGRREAKAIQSLTEGLLLSGLAMSIHGDSRPASGAEHHLAHFWEMRAHLTETDCASHGAMVGVAAILVLRLWSELSSITPERFAQDRPASERDACIRTLYGVGAEALLRTENPVYPSERIAAHWQEILDIARSLPAPEQLVSLLGCADGEVTPAAIGIGTLCVRDSVIWARERKKCCTLLQLLGSLGRLEDFAGRVGQDARFLRSVRCFVLDLDGTVYLDGVLFPYTLAFLETLRVPGIDYLFFTNNSSESAAHTYEKLQSLGIPLSERQICTSAQVLLAWLANNETGRRVFVAGTPGLKAEFRAAGYTLDEETPDFAVLGFDKTMDYAVLTRLCDHARGGKPVYGANMDYNCPVKGGYVPDCGSLAAALTAATGVRPMFFGKPSRHTLDYILCHTGLREEELCFVGDRLYTDIAVTKHSRAHSILVLSGESRAEDVSAYDTQPDLTLESLETLAERLRAL